MHEKRERQHKSDLRAFRHDAAVEKEIVMSDRTLRVCPHCNARSHDFECCNGPTLPLYAARAPAMPRMLQDAEPKLL